MILPDKAVVEFEGLWRKRFGEELPPEKARAFAEQLYGLVKAVVDEPIPGAFPLAKNKGPP
ncbi:MAG: hypothetical protein WCJ29_03170 [bacterium]